MLDKATEITRKIFTGKLGDDDEGFGYIFSSYLRGMDGEEDYILSQCTTGGYAIYEAESMELIEYSDTEISPYAEIAQTDRYYAGIANYFVGNGNDLENLHTKERIEKKYGRKIANEVKEKTKRDKEVRKAKKEAKEEDVIVSRNEYEDKTGEQNDDIIDPGVTGIDIVNADIYVVQSRTYIDDYQFFIDNHEHGYNFDGTCASVAAQLLLAYNNWAKDGRLIPKTQGALGEEFIHKEWTENSRLIPYSKAMRGTNSSDDNTDDEISLYEKMKEYINPYARSYNEKYTVDKNPNNSGATIIDTKNGISNFILEYASDQSWAWSIDGAYVETEVAEEKLKNEIDENRAAIAPIYTYSIKSGEIVRSGHQVVVYGYQTIKYEGENLNGFIAHFGWKGETSAQTNGKNTHIWFNSSWLKGYLTLQTNHEHSASVEIQGGNGHIFECDECKVSYIKNNHTTKSVKEMTNINKDYEKYYNQYHIAVCGCGYESKKKHSFRYININSSTSHRVICACGYGGEEVGAEEGEKVFQNHFFKHGDSCFYCDYML